MAKLTIVTIVRNHKEGFVKTVESVRAQSFADYEYIVVDGASSDGTTDVIREYTSLFSAVIYDADKGIYDAMNRGLEQAKGEYIIFMNAGDVFAHKDSLRCMFEKSSDADLVYGDYTVNYGYMTRYVKGLPLKEIWKGMLSSHQAFIIRTALVKYEKFDCSVKLGADFDMIYRLYKEGRSFCYVPCEVAITEAGGMSDKKRMTVYKNHLDTIRQYGITPYKLAYYIYAFADAFCRLSLKKILPVSMVRRITKMKVDR